MKISLDRNQFFDNEGNPLSAGRISIYALNTSTLLPTYTLNGSDFVVASNPFVFGNDGRCDTVFFDAALVTVKVERSNGDGTYSQVDTFEAGFRLGEASGSVDTVSDLRSADTSLGLVAVTGYYVAGDCPVRKYLWVPNASNIDDGGYIVASTVNNSGRWVMMWEGERLPVSLYGVMQGHSGQAMTTNLFNLFDLQKSIMVGNLLVSVPDIIDFDGRIHGTDDASPLSYYISATRLTTIHYVSASQYVSINTSNSFAVQIHCAGFRGDIFINAGWVFDQYLVNQYKDPFERVSTKMFNGNTSAAHDAFMTCVGCSKVKFVELSKDGTGTTLYDLLTPSDSFSGKIIINLSDEIDSNINKSGVYLDRRTAALTLQYITAYSASFTSGSVSGNFEIGGKSIATSGVFFGTSLNECAAIGKYNGDTNKASLGKETHSEEDFYVDSRLMLGENVVTPRTSSVDLQGSGFGDLPVWTVKAFYYTENTGTIYIQGVGPSGNDAVTLGAGKGVIVIKVDSSNHWYPFG